MHILNQEKQHEDLYRAHWSITGGGEHIHAVIVQLQQASRYSDVREKLRPVITLLEEARDHADKAWNVAGKARTELIRLTGCNGTCSDAAVDGLDC